MRTPRIRTAAWNVAGFKIKRPYPDFPLTPHASGKWMKKINGGICYFGTWARRVNGKLERVEGDGWKEALELYRVQADDLHAGRTPSVTLDQLTIADLCNRFLTAKQRKSEAGEISPRMFRPGPVGADGQPRHDLASGEYKLTTDRLVRTFGAKARVEDLKPDDFGRLRAELAGQFGPVRLANEIQKVRSVFKFGMEDGLILKPVLYGSQFQKPGRRVMRVHRAKAGKRTFDAREIRLMLDYLAGEEVTIARVDGATGDPVKLNCKPNPTLRAMVLLGINAALGNSDCGTLPKSALDLDGGWLTYPRPKTGIERRVWLWPETIAAIREAIGRRPEPRDESNADLVFLTRWGSPWASDGTNGVAHQFGKLLKKLGINGRKGIGFYSFRHTFRTVADATRDPNAIRLVMGHTDDDRIDANYTHGLADSRLRAVADHVRVWLFGEAATAGRFG
jgi:integrase